MNEGAALTCKGMGVGRVLNKHRGVILKEGDVSETHMYIESDMARNKMDCHTREWAFPAPEMYVQAHARRTTEWRI